MKSKDDILYETHKDLQGQGLILPRVKIAMDEWSKEIAIGFYEWVDKNKYEKYANSDAGHIWYFNEPPTAGKQTYFELSELFNQYIQTINQ